MASSDYSTLNLPAVYWEVWNTGDGLADGLVYGVALRGHHSRPSVTHRYYLLSAAIEHLKLYSWPPVVLISRTLTPVEGEIIARGVGAVGFSAYCNFYHNEEA